MLYKSSRGDSENKTSAQAILSGIAIDGGLFVPIDKLPDLSNEIKNLGPLSYQERAMYILKYFLTDFSEEEIKACVTKAYNQEKFDSPKIAPLKTIDEEISVLELWHGPTSAFKDMALQILPHLLTTSAAKENDNSKYAILVATSGDTGKAALEGFKNVNNTSILVFYPNDGVSEIQKLQMVTQEGNNVKVIAINGNFDDTQNGVKKIFTDDKIKEKIGSNNYKFSSANSINWGRLVPQIAYYFSAYADLLQDNQIECGEKVNFVVPTGNFGNILAGYYAKLMGLPINKLVCASNENNVLTDFINTGSYNRIRPFNKTISPSMDILISSNLERLLYHITNGNTESILKWMKELQESGSYTVDSKTFEEIKNIFWSSFSTDKETVQRIKDIYDKFNYTIDTHTAVAWDVLEKYKEETKDNTLSIIVSTASPFKFNTSVLEAITESSDLSGDEFKLLATLSEKSGMEIPKSLKELENKSVLHQETCAKEDMAAKVLEFLKI